MLTSEFLPATGAARQQLVLLHGWASSREIWRPLVTALRPWADVLLVELPDINGEAGTGDWQQLMTDVLAVAPRRAVYLGWSLGGQLAVDIAAAHPTRVAALATMGYNPVFTGGKDWPGMPAVEFADFCAAVATEPRAALRRFDALQADGASQPRALMRSLAGCRGEWQGAALHHSLAWLKTDQRALLTGLCMPQLHLLAAADRLVPAEVYPACQALLAATPQAAVRQLPQLCHAAPLCSPRQLATALMDFLAAHNVFSEPGATAAPLEKTDVARSFSRAASTYDAVAALQRRVGDSLLQLAPGPEEGVARLLDLGCGTGHFHAALTERYPDASYYGLDLAAGMVQFARQRSCEPAQWLVADAEALPLAANSVDLVFSSLAIQWCYRLDLLFAELQRVLRPGGRCVFSTLGPGTLTELRQSWAAADAHQHVNEFLPLGQLQQAVAAFPQLQLSIEREVMQVRYPRVRNLFDELKGLGAHNVNTARPAGLSGRRQLSTMMQAYEAFRDADNLLPASYEVYFGTLERR